MNRKNKDKISSEQKKVYGDRIRALRIYKGLNLERFAEPLSVGFKAVSSYENGNAVASEAIVRELERIYLMNRDWYETGEGKMLREAVKYDNSNHEEDMFKNKSTISYEDESFSVLRTDQIDLLKMWEKLDCKKRGALMVIMESLKGQGE